MKPTTVSRIGICGAGTMGRGIAQACAMHGYQVILFDANEIAAAAAKDKIMADLQSLAAKNKISSAEEVCAHITVTSSIADCLADVIIEAIIEDMDAKASLLNSLAAINAPASIFVTNTSSLSVTRIAEQFSKPGQLAGMHFFNPPTAMKLVEVVATSYSSAETIDAIVQLAASIGKTPVICRDAPGFIVNHVARPYYLEALHLAEKYSVPTESIDRLMESAGFKMGPFRLMDLIGNDINYSVSCTVFEAMNKPERLQPSLLQKEKVTSGHLGRKTGRGFYDYNR